jgi:hypothetical protein
MDAENVAQRIRFDTEYRLPPEYWNRLRQQPKMEDEEQHSATQNSGNKSKVNFKKIDPNEWAKAPEFIPRHQQSLATSFGYSNPLSNIPFNNNNGIIYGSSTTNNDNFNPNLMTTSFTASMGNPFPQSQSSETSFVTMPPPTMPKNGVPFNFQPIFNQAPPPPPSQFQPFQACVPLPPSGRFGNFVPKGYSANIASINSGIGPPIAAIVLKKKRKRRSRRVMNDFSPPSSGRDGSCGGYGQQHPNDPNNFYDSLNDVKRHHQQQQQHQEHWEQKYDKEGSIQKQKNIFIRGQIRSMSSEPDLTSMTNSDNGSRQINGRLTSVDSCPELSEDQLKIWDDILYNAVVKDSVQQNSTKKMRKELSATKISSRSETPEILEKPKSESPVMRTSIYELCPASIYDEDNNAEFVDENEREKFLEEMSNSRSAVFDPNFAVELNKPKQNDRPKTIEDSFNLIQQSSNELEDLKFKPLPRDKMHVSASQYMTYFNPKNNGVKNEVYNPDYDLDPQIEEDFFEGMRIRVNAFEDCEDLTLSESECPQPSRFQQLQWALQRQRERYVQVAPPDRACCTLM